MKTNSLKKTLALALFSLCLKTNHAQITLTGSVMSPDKKVIPFSVVGIKDTYLSAQANSLGAFTFTNLKPGKYVLITKCIGYKSHKDSLLVDANKTIEITLTQDEVALDEIVVNATRADQSSAYAYSNVSSEEIKKQNLGQDLPYALNSIPSVVINSDAGNGVGYTGIRIRGTDGTRINVTINGVPVNDAESQGTFLVNMPDLLSSTNNIQVQRGVGTSANGAGAFGASVNMQTNQLNDKAYAQLNNSIGSFNTIKNTVIAGTGLINNHFTFDARASRILSDGYIDRAFSKLYSYYLSGGYYGKKTVVKAILFSGNEKTYQAWYYVPQDSINNENRTYNPAGEYVDANGKTQYYKNETDNYKQDNFQLHVIHSFNDKLTANITGHYTAGKGYYEQYKQGQSLSKYNMPDVITTNDTITTTDLIRRRWLDNDFVGALGNINYKPSTLLNFILGGGYNTYFGRHNGEVVWAQYSNPNDFKPRYYDNKATKTDGNVYLKTIIKPTDKLTAFIDLQYRNINYNFLGYDTSLITPTQVYTSFQFFNPKVGINYLISPKATVYASYGIANKEPSRDDFTQATKKSRPKSERLLDLEVGASYRFKKVAIALNLYDMEYQNQLVLNGQINDVGNYNRANVDYSYRRGIELEVNSTINNYLAFNGNITFSQNKIKSFKEYIDSSDVNYTIYTQYKKEYQLTDISFSPNVIASANLIVLPIKNLQITFLNKYVGKQFLDNTSNNERSLTDYFVADLRLNYMIETKLIPEINLIAALYNYGNTKYASNGYTFSYYEGEKLYTKNFVSPSAPTHFMLGLNVRF